MEDISSLDVPKSVMKTSTFRVGVKEMLFAVYPILIYYSYGFASIGDFLILFLGIYIFIVNKSYFLYKPLLYLLLFILIHEFILSFILPSLPNYFINNNLIIAFNIIIIGSISSALDSEKLYNSFIIIGIISMIGLLVHFIQIHFFGQVVHPIQIPLFPELNALSRYSELGYRPVSLFPEPSSYVIYMTIPLFWSLKKKRILMSAIITGSILLSTSTNGFVIVAILWITFVFSNNYGRKYKVSLIIVVISLGFIVANSLLFDAGVKKIKKTELSNNDRIVNGPLLYNYIPLENKIFGINSPNVNDYVLDNNTSRTKLIVSYKSIFVSTFWLILIKFGPIGLFIYLLVYFKLYKTTQPLRPYILIVFISMFSQAIYLGGNWVMQIVVMLVIYQKDNQDKFATLLHHHYSNIKGLDEK